jgi:nucleoside-diphosphate-sugar epimerase
MKVLVLGATGYIGSCVASAFRRAGYDVWGLTRSPEKAPKLAIEEIHPIVGDMQLPESYRSIAEESDVLVQAAMDSQHEAEKVDRQVAGDLLRISTSSSRPITIIYTGGSWDYGSRPGGPVNETTPPRPLQAAAWRPEVEAKLLDHTGARVVIIRPGNAYGHVGGMTPLWFTQAAGSPVLQIVGDGSNHWPMVHVDDLAEGYVLAAENGISGEIFNLSDGTSATVREIVAAIGQAAGFNGRVEYLEIDQAVRQMGAFAEAFALDLQLDSSKAERLLDWRSRKPGFVAEAHTYFHAWSAAQHERPAGDTSSS